MTDAQFIPSHNENRKIDRRQLVYYLKVYETDTHELSGFLGDISGEGLMLFRPDAIEPGRIFSFTLFLKKEFGMDSDLVFDARSVWCEPDANPDYYAVGFKFVDLTQSGLDMVVYLMEKIGFV